MNSHFPKRCHPRLKQYDYSTPGAYFVTICAHNRRCLFSRIIKREFAPSETQLSEYGRIAKEQLFLLENRYSNLKVAQYVIMPNHIHALLLLEEAVGDKQRPAITDIICAYKSLVTRECKKIRPIEKLFQISFYEHVIRNQEDYDEIAAYIVNNPKQWELDKLYSQE